MLRGPANRPQLLVPAALALALVVALAIAGRWVLLAVVVLAAALPGLWRRWGPRPRTGRVRRSWPWHDD